MFLLLLACAVRAPSPAPGSAASDVHAAGTPAAPPPAMGAPPTLDPGPAAERVRAALLADEPEAWTPLRATLAAVVPYADPPDPDAAHPLDTVVASDDGDIVRVLHESAGIRVVVGVRRADLAPRPDDRTPLAAAPDGRVPDGAYVALAGGTPVTLGERAADAVRVTWVEDGVTLDAWAPADKLVPVWHATTWPGEEFWSDLHLAAPEGAVVTVPLQDAPNGGTLATLRSEAWLPLRRAGLPVDGWQPVEVWGETFHARGWVPRDSVWPRERVAMGYGSGGGTPPLRNMRVAELAAGTWIRPEGAADPFARAVRDAQVEIVADEGARLRVRFRSAWGWLPGEVDCPRRTPKTGAVELRCEP